MPQHPPDRDDDDVRLLYVPLGREALVILDKMSRDAGTPPLELAADLLTALLYEDDAAHRRPTLN